MKFAHLEEKTNKILGWYDDSIHIEIPTSSIEATEDEWQEAIIINANCYEYGKFIVKDFRTDEEIEAQRVLLIKRKSGDIIESQYPLFKQLNITNLLDGYTQEDKTKMIDFINSIRAISNKAELKGTALEDINWGIE